MKTILRAALILSVLPLASVSAQDLQTQQQDTILEQIQKNSADLMPKMITEDAADSPAQPEDTAQQTPENQTLEDQTPEPQPSEEQVAFEPIPPKELPAKYSPDYCEFEAAFPEAPYIKTQCDGGESGTECYEHVSYTQTFALDATVTLRVVCNKIGQDIKDKYDEDIMVKTLEAMTKQNVVQKFSTSYMEDESGDYRLAGLVGEGKVGMTPSIFIAQMWLGKQSAMTVEAELVGEQFNESDALFRDLLRGVRYKSAQNADNATDTDSSEEAPKAVE